MGKLTIYVARHGKTLMNTLDRVQGWCDSPLTKEGEKIAEYLGQGLKDIHFRAAYCSDLRRTLHTARIVLNSKGQQDLGITEIQGLREACFGSFESGNNNHMWNSAALYMQYTDLDQVDEALANKEISYGDLLDVIAKLDKMGIAENYEQLRTRTQNALKEIAHKESVDGEGNILIISHGMSIAGMLLSLGGEKLIKSDLKNASICKVTYEEGEFTVESMGDMSYVEKGKRIAEAIYQE